MVKRSLMGIMVAALISGASSTDLEAGSASANLSVTAAVIGSCTIGTSALAFGNYDPFSGSPTNSTGTVTVTCTLGAAVSIDLDNGANFNNPNRRMASGTNRLNYEIYSDTLRTVRWGSGTGNNVTAVGTGAADAHTAFGQIPAGQNVPPGSYTDTVVATVNF